MADDVYRILFSAFIFITSFVAQEVVYYGLITEICVSGHYVPQLSQAIVRYNTALKEKAINLKGYMV